MSTSNPFDQSPSIREVSKRRADLEKRLMIDIKQFEEDTGCQVGMVSLLRTNRLGTMREDLIDVHIQVEIPR